MHDKMDKYGTGKYADLIDDLYQSISSDVLEVIEDPDITDVVTMIEVLCKIASMVEVIKIGEKNLKGYEKKELVHNFGRFLIEKHCPFNYTQSLLDVYDSSAERVLENIILFAKQHKVLSKAGKCATTCC